MGIGLVASIAQLIGFGVVVIERLNDYRSQCKDVPKAFTHICAQLPLLVQILERTSQDLDSEQTDRANKQMLGPVIVGCKSLLGELDDILSKIMPGPNDSRAVRVKKAFLSMEEESDILRIHSRLATYVSTLTFYFAWSSGRHSSKCISH